MPETERPQEYAQGRRGHHLMPQDPPGATGAQHIRVVDVAGASHNRMHQGENLAAGTGPADQAGHAHRGVDQPPDTQPGRQRGHHQQPGVGHQTLIIEAHRQPVGDMRYWSHRKCLPDESGRSAW